ncbi:MAG: sulfatase-like hydrolase/transferase [Deltaproteobacteria bacterium]|nr:sulfatase-like hydrolase/transferase [Deltaproteobacteria bacterium]
MVLGALGGLGGALADYASTVLWLVPGPDRGRLAFALLGLGAGCGAVLGALGSALDALLGRRLRDPWRALALVAPPLLPVAHWLFQGGFMRRLPAQGALQALTWALLVGVATAAVVLARRAAPRVDRASGRVRGAVALALGALGWSLHGLDHRVLPRLYEYLHVGLGALTGLSFAAALALALPRWARGRRGALALAAVSAPWAVVSFGALERWPNVRAELFGVHAPFVRHVVVGLAALSGPARVDPEALRRARLARAPSPRDPSGLPSSPDAHVLLVTVDALRADRVGRSVAGRSLTPTLDALVRQGVWFQRAYAQAPHSSYSLTSLHTGEYLHETVPLGQPQPLETLAEALRAQGFHAAAFYTHGVFFTEAERLQAYRARDLGFPRADHVDRDADALTRAACDELDDVVRRGEPRTFLWVHYFDAHAPYQGAGDGPEARYDSAVARVDRALGALLAHARGVLSRPLVLAVTADHGEEFGEHGGVYHGSALYDEQVRVPLVLVAPGLGPGVVPEPVELLDLAPTLAALAGARAPAGARGRDLRPRLSAPSAETPVFSAVNTRRMVVLGGWKYLTDTAWPVEELYDLGRDPGERRNLAGAEPSRRQALRAELALWVDTLARSRGGNPALARARLGERGALPALVALALDPSGATEERAEAVALAASFGPSSDLSALRPLLLEPSGTLAEEAALALGQARDRGALPRLLDLAVDERPSVRRRAALALAALGDPRALPGLSEALHATDEGEALGALRALGSLGVPEALEPLLGALPDDHLRYRAALVLGELRDPRAYGTLLALARSDPTDDVRANAVAALGALGDRRAVPFLLGTLSVSRAERYAAEALGALGAVGAEVEGFDARARGCEVHTDTLGWRYLGARSCRSEGPSLGVPVRLHGGGPRLLVLRLRRGEDGPAVPVSVRLGDREVARVSATTAWEEPRVQLPEVPVGEALLTLRAEDPASTLRLCHAVFVR